MGKRSVFVFAAALIMAGLNGLPRAQTQQVPPCANAQTAGKTAKQIQLDNCSCEQSVAQDKPTYRVGAAPFGRNAALRVGKSARGGSVRGAPSPSAPASLYEGLEMPDLKDLRSPEVVGLKEKVARARQEARQKVEASLARARAVLQRQPRNWLANRVVNSPRARKAYEQFVALQSNGQWASRPKFDWRAQGLDVGPVLNQGSCGSCWAFAAVSVYQSSWNLEQLRLGDQFFTETVPEYGSHQRIPSVQQLLNCIGQEKGSCDSGWHATAFAFMVNSHVPHIPDRLVFNNSDRAVVEEYTGRASRCTDMLRDHKVKRGGKSAVPGVGGDGSELPANSDLILTAYDRALAWGYVNEQKPDQPSIGQLKQALIEHGPLAMPIYGDACFSVYQSGLFSGHSAGKLNHVVVLIGWDDEQQAWLIKNSWGQEWGEQGFGWVGYGSNSIGQYAAWIQPTPQTVAN